MFAVSPITNCPHVPRLEEEPYVFFPVSLNETNQHQGYCCSCESSQENWLCLTCKGVFCSRYVNGHMQDHFEAEKHAVAFSLSDASFWCYECDIYVTTPLLREYARHYGSIKFPNGVSDAAETVVGDHSSNDGDRHTHNADIIYPTVPAQAPSSAFTRSDLVNGLKSRAFQRIAVLTGAGISVAAGIPDFRTPGTGLYAQVARLGLPFPEAIFHLDYFSADPTAFYTIANEFLTYRAQPVLAHKFIRKLQDEDVLMYNYTQNIDGLELEAGVRLDKLVQAHGHMRSARCISCREECDVEMFMDAIRRQQVLFCPRCNPPDEELVQRDALVKPDIVFFGEALPDSFRQVFPLITTADLVIVMGTSLKVYPFAFLLQAVNDSVPLVLINRENPGISRENFLFLPGEIEETIGGLAGDLDWQL